MTNPVRNPRLYDSFKLAGRRSPGRCKFNFPKRELGWDVQVPKGSTGGNTVLNNTKPMQFEVEIYVWDGDDEFGAPVDHFARWDAWKAVLDKPIKPTDPKALDIFHPQLEGLKPPVRSVVVQSYCEPQPDGKGGGTAKITLLEFRPIVPKKAKTPKGSDSWFSTDELAGKKSDPNADLKAEVKKLTEAYKRAG